MDGQTIAAIVSVFLTFVGLNIGALKWLLDRHDGAAARTADIEKKLLELRAELPIEYVRREDWIRFSNTLEAKMDALRAESREEMSKLRETLLRIKGPFESVMP